MYVLLHEAAIKIFSKTHTQKRSGEKEDEKRRKIGKMRLKMSRDNGKENGNLKQVRWRKNFHFSNLCVRCVFGKKYVSEIDFVQFESI